MDEPETPSSGRPAAPRELKAYLLEHSPEFRECQHQREEGWKRSAGDKYFQKRQGQSDNPSKKAEDEMYDRMIRAGTELNDATGVFHLSKADGSNPSVLDLCTAPGGFLTKILELNPKAYARVFTLPPTSGGVNFKIPRSERVNVTFLDITMLFQDMGSETIPPLHNDRDKFVTRTLKEDETFDLVICGGTLARPHLRAKYGEDATNAGLEADRLQCAQLVLGLQHLRPGGKMVVVGHKIDHAESAHFLYRFSKFASIETMKPWAIHSLKNSFYMVASDVQTRSPEALEAVRIWRNTWRASTFGTEEDRTSALRGDSIEERKLVREFGPRLLVLGKQVWEVQAQALAGASFMKQR